MTFREKYLSGQCSFDAIEDEFDKWHDEETGVPTIYEYLGFTLDEYAMFVKGELKFKQYLDDIKRQSN